MHLSVPEEKMVRSGVSDAVYEAVLDAIYAGTIPQGERINDLDLAKEMGISRTPVREAIQRLRDIGIVEAAPNRYTRIAQLSEQQVRDAIVVWRALYLALIEEVMPKIDSRLIARLRKDSERFLAATRKGDAKKAAEHNYDFFARIQPLSRNRYLVGRLDGIAHLLRLGVSSLPDWHNAAEFSEAQHELISAYAAKDLAAAERSLRNAIVHRVGH